ncbi:AsmA-like C-terminal domain-containing protein, partial [Acinetobacter baumannii]
IDLNNQRIQITGTFIPLYGLNNLVSRIPLLGEIAGAGRNEGLVGVTFKVVGSVDDPVLQVNPISAIAPGIFRRIFEYHVDGPRAGDETERSP